MYNIIQINSLVFRHLIDGRHCASFLFVPLYFCFICKQPVVQFLVWTVLTTEVPFVLCVVYLEFQIWKRLSGIHFLCTRIMSARRTVATLVELCCEEKCFCSSAAVLSSSFHPMLPKRLLFIIHGGRERMKGKSSESPVRGLAYLSGPIKETVKCRGYFWLDMNSSFKTQDA